MAAPVCHINPSQEINQPAIRLLSSVGNPTDLPSALRAIRQLTLVINMITGAQPIRSGSTNTSGGTTTGGTGGFNTRPQSPKRPGGGGEEDGRWNEVRNERVVEKVRIQQEGNPENWVEFERINSISYVDSVTGEKWKWRRK